MRFATFNIWNEASNLACRTPLLMREITRTAADIIALQEVPQAFFADSLSALSQYPWRTFRSYTGEEEGLAVLSRHPITDCTFLQQSAAYGCARALNVWVDAGGERISFTNVHLPWDSPLAREEQITAINGFLQTQQADHFLLLGDFNCGPSSSVHRFLTGEQSLLGKEANPCWMEVCENVATLRGQPLLPTLDCVNNPRWKGKNRMYTPENMDRVYVLDVWKDYDFADAVLFGTAADPEIQLCASDHYGVVVDIRW